MGIKVDISIVIVVFFIVIISMYFIMRRKQALSLKNPENQRVEELKNELRNALEREELFLLYQPKLCLSSGKIVGVEALLRWKHPEKGVITPDEFIPLAEDTGLILPIGEWVLRTACMQNKIWQKAGLPPIVISVNLSVRQFYQPNLTEMVRNIIEETGLQPEFLELEVTESMLMDIQHGITVLKKLRGLGVKVSLDDFGTGYSSLLHLKELPINKLKIDQSFIKNCTEDSDDATIVKTIIAMAHQLKLTVVAEGIETIEHLVLLQRNVCNEGQGYLFSKPIPPDEIVQRYEEIEQFIAQNGIPKELSNQKWMEEALQIARQELVDTIRNQQGMIFKFIKKEDKFIHTIWDGELLNRMGLLPEQIIGKELADFLPDNIAAEMIEFYQRAWDGEDKVSFESEINGIYYIASLRPIQRGGQVVEVIGSGIDITEKRNVEKALKQSEFTHRLIAENMKDLVSVCDVNGRITYASPSHKIVLGFSPELNNDNLDYDWVHLDDIPLLQQRFTQIISSKKPGQIEFRVKHVNGHWMHIEAQLNPVLGEHGEVDYFVVVGRDISERKKTDEFIQKTGTLSVVGQLAAGIAHEIRNPLTSIKGFLQMMRNEATMPRSYIDIALSEINDIEVIINEFLSFSKPQPMNLSKVDVYALLQKVVRLIETQTILKNVDIIQEIEPEMPFIYGDYRQIKQVFINILYNSLDAISGGGSITIQAKKLETDQVIFRFIDNGCGITEDRLMRIAEPFYSTKEKGTGLGIMVCHKIIGEHKGKINFASKPGEGTTVEIILPINERTH
ncbi:EAL domain-containing protein [Bacillus sp. FJAT-49736]|uniref:EAL domain-containing protein n=1 Tax=Bacillus sp. FJAT-49736 TaxID=2833582 RepID=UPI001BC8F70D|nr:EAL domain-containing protein [Bacillus sp. FJAT-49736]MBS4174244.1 EAL domain-containing protein [Bacillus sp. FJAT-49736]